MRQLHELNHYHFHNNIAIKQNSFNYNKYSLIYQGLQNQKSRSYKESSMFVCSPNSKHVYITVFSPVSVLGKTSHRGKYVCRGHADLCRHLYLPQCLAREHIKG